MNRYSLILLTLCALFGIGLELGERYELPRITYVDGRLAREHARANALKPVPGEPIPVLIVGNSLLKKAVIVPRLNERLHPEYAVARFVVEQTSYLDWYYGLRRLFREGARPKAVILVLNARQLIAPDVYGDHFAQLLMDRRDLLSVKQTIATDNTTTSNLFFANLSRFYGLRSEVHNWFLARLMPDFAALAEKLRPPTLPLPADEEIDREATRRLKEISSLCTNYGGRFILVVPPSGAATRDGSSVIQRAGNRIGVQVLVPLQSQQLPSDMYSDGFHLNYQGASIFTDALGSGLRQLLRNDSPVQSAESNLGIRGSGSSLSVDQPSQQK